MQDLTGVIFSMVGDVRVDSDASTVTSSIFKICRLSLLKVLMRVGLNMSRIEYACVSAFVVCFARKNMACSKPLLASL
jgi:hypothetical protein